MSITDADTFYPGVQGHFNETGIGRNPYPAGECTYYIWQFYHDTQHVDIPPALGNATEWVTSAHREGWTVDNNPVAGKTVCWSAAKYPPFGHVAVVSQVNGDGSFDVLEMNFTYFASENENLAGKIDKRTVRDRDGITGFITPNNVTVSNGQDNDPGFLGMKAIGDAITQAGLYLEASAMTAEHKLMSMAQVGVGLVVSGGGATLMALTLAGNGDPGKGYSAIKSRVRSARKTARPVIARDRAYKAAEEAWLSRQARAEMAENKRLAIEHAKANPVHFGLTNRRDIARDRRIQIAAGRRRNLPLPDEPPF